MPIPAAVVAGAALAPAVVAEGGVMLVGGFAFGLGQELSHDVYREAKRKLGFEVPDEGPARVTTNNYYINQMGKGVPGFNPYIPPQDAEEYQKFQFELFKHYQQVKQTANPQNNMKQSAPTQNDIKQPAPAQNNVKQPATYVQEVDPTQGELMNI